MGLQFQKSKPTLRQAKVLLIGDAGTGKTHAALTFPKPAVIDAEGSIDWFADRFEFVSVATKSYRDVQELLRQVRSGSVDCDTVVIDSLTSIYNGLVNAASSERDDLRPLDWGRIKRKFSGLLDELYHKTNKHVVCIGWVKADYAKQGDRVAGKVVGANDMVKLGETFDGDKKAMHAFDFVLRLEAKDGQHFATVLKSRSGGLREGQRIENFSWKTIENLIPKGATPIAGMTDDEQIARDREERAVQPAAAREAPGLTVSEPIATTAAAPAADLEAAAAHKRAVVEIYEMLGLDRKSKDRGTHGSAIALVAVTLRMASPSTWSGFSISELEQFISQKKMAAEATRGPVPSETHDRFIELLAENDIANDDLAVQEACGDITRESDAGVRYDWHALDDAELAQLLAQMQRVVALAANEEALL